MAFGAKPEATAAPSIDFKSLFKPAVELKPPVGLKIGIYGKPKVGKTHFALSAPGTKYFIDTEDALSINIQKFPQQVRDETFVLSAMKCVPGSHRKIDYDATIFHTFDATESIIEQIIANEEQCTIIVDSITDIWDWLGNWLYDVAGRKSDKDKTKLSMQTEWGKANGPYLEFLKMLWNAPCNVIITAKTSPAYAGAQMLDYDVPNWQKRTPYWLNTYGELSYNGIDRAFRFDGSRMGDLTGTVSKPTFDSIKQYIIENTGVMLG